MRSLIVRLIKGAAALAFIASVIYLKQWAGQPHRISDVQPSASNGFVEILGRCVDPYFVVAVETPDGSVHEFALDTGWTGTSTISRKLAAQLGLEPESGTVQCRMLLADGRKLEFPAKISDQITTIRSKPADGAVGLNLLSTLQLKVDYASGRVWCRQESTVLSQADAASALATPNESGHSIHLAKVPLSVSNRGWYTIPVSIDGHQLQGSLDTGASALFISPKFVADLGLSEIGGIKVSTPFGTEQDGVYWANSLEVGGFPMRWPVVRSSPNQPDTGVTFSTSYLPQRVSVIDFPGKALYFRAPNSAELLDEGIREYMNRPIAIREGQLRMNWSDQSRKYPGLERSPIIAVQGIPSSKWVELMTSLSKGDISGVPVLISAYKETFSHENLTVLWNGKKMSYPSDFPTGG